MGGGHEQQLVDIVSKTDHGFTETYPEDNSSYHDSTEVGAHGDGGHGEYGLNYTIIGVGVLTLGVLLVVEFFRHKLDGFATKHPFLQTVLELMYREFTTLGIVEFLLYRLHKWQNFDFEMEDVFIDVHFMLFYTAIFNAIQSVLVRLLTASHTDKEWIQTEEIDLGSYVSIRRELGRVEAKLEKLKQRGSGSRKTHDAENNSRIRQLFDGVVTRLKYPHLSQRRRQLLVQVRFHDLRAQFIESNNLPSKFRVSRYLKRSLTNALVDFVHISPAAWIMLMATGSCVYFLSGIFLDTFKDPLVVTKFLVISFFEICALFVVGAFVLYHEVNSIFNKIMDLQFPSDSFNQLDLFWGSNPRSILFVAQYMQFAYAIAFALLFTFWQGLHADSLVKAHSLLMTLIISYGIFLQLVSKIIPRYTLCTSLGQLVNKGRLQETLAKLKLNEEKKRRTEVHDEFEHSDTSRLLSQDAISHCHTSITHSVSSQSLPSTEREDHEKPTRNERSRRRRVQSDITEFMQPQASTTTRKSNISSENEKPRRTRMQSDLSDFMQPQARSGQQELVMTRGNEKCRRTKMQSDLSAFIQPSYRRKESQEKEAESDSKLAALKELASVSTDDLPDIPEFLGAGSKQHHILAWSENRRRENGASGGFEVVHINPKVSPNEELAPIDRNRNDQLLAGETSSIFSLTDKIRAFFRSSQYKVISAILGPMACFLIIGMRVEGFNIVSGALIDEEGSTLPVELSTLFWIEVTWYCFMTLEFAMIFVVFWVEKNRPDVTSCTAACWGLSVCALCMCLFILAEIERCPDHNAHCEHFGERTYGGLGGIEPWTALIILSTTRFAASRMIGHCLGVQNAVAENSDIHSHTSLHHGPDIKKAARKLWLTSIGVYSEAAEKYGILSGQFLQTMLGVSIEPSSMTAAEPSSTKVTTHDMLVKNSTYSSLEYFSYSRARLLIGVCRCKRILMPLLDEWINVAAVLTSYELVLFDASCNDDESCINAASNHSKHLRLCDVAKGRKVVNHFELDDVQSVHIGRRPSGNRNLREAAVDTLHLRRNQVEEKHLQIVFPFGTLLLCFDGDLDEAGEQEGSHGVNKASANYWYQAISRLQDASQVKTSDDLNNNTQREDASVRYHRDELCEPHDVC